LENNTQIEKGCENMNGTGPARAAKERFLWWRFSDRGVAQ